jgi:hypothetical protein
MHGGFISAVGFRTSRLGLPRNGANTPNMPRDGVNTSIFYRTLDFTAPAGAPICTPTPKKKSKKQI